MKDPKKEVEEIAENPIKTDIGAIYASKGEDPTVHVSIHSFKDRPFGSMFTFSPEEWSRHVELMREYFKKSDERHTMRE